MKRMAFAIFLSCFLAACGQPEQPKPVSAPAAVAPVAPVKTHNYSLRDGFEYGYERAVSPEQQQKGQLASALMMAKFAGQRDGKYQAYSKDADQIGSVVVLECSNPCEFMKVMVFVEGGHVSTQRLRVAPGIIGWMILEDAINGELEQYVAERDGRKFTVWFDEKKGLVTTPFAQAQTAQ